MLHPDAPISATTKVKIQSHPGERWTVSCCALNKRDGRSFTDGFGLLYAKRTQFRIVEAATLEGWRCRKPARRQAWPTLDRVAQTGAEWDRQTRKLDNACPAGAAGRVASGGWRMPNGGWRMPDG